MVTIIRVALQNNDPIVHFILIVTILSLVEVPRINVISIYNSEVTDPRPSNQSFYGRTARNDVNSSRGLDDFPAAPGTKD